MDDPQPENTESFEFDSLSRVVTACERFEAEWRDGRAPRIETYLDGVEPGLRDKLLRELLAIEVELRVASGEAPTPEEYLARCADWAQAVALVFPQDPIASNSDDTGLEPTPPSAAHSPHSTETGSALSNPLSDPTVTAYPLSASRAQSTPIAPLPERFGRYAVTGLLGSGAFGSVYLARDDELGRLVAIKVPRPGLLRSPDQVESFLVEARMAAGLGHPAIVRVYDVGRYGEGEVFVVFEYVEGQNLAEIFKVERFSPARIARLLIEIAEAAHFAHRAGLIHRDLKPSNILIDGKGRPLIADFGLAVREDLQHLRTGEVAGTPSYMAPEQVRGETHRLDARTDVWALGVILYLGLLRRHPFSGRDRERIFHEVLNHDPKPPRQVNSTIPRELDRICLKCLSKRMADRYETAADLAEDLRSWLAAQASSDSAPPPTRIVPKGLRAFDTEDADFFLTLVPGPRDRDGLPESIRAWKRRIEELDPSRTFAVGLLYGPSGSGKSSFVKAGLLPRLGPHVRPVYIEASPNGTEPRLLAALRRECPELPADCGLDLATAAIREGRAARAGSKVLLVLDQFEQWLHSHPDEGDGELVRALRHCDGPGLQALLLVRDDFWMAITRFLRVLEIRPIEGVNSAAVELFDLQHARRVLAELGRALGGLPEKAEPGEPRFLDKAVKELAGSDGRVIPVRLTLFAEMLRHRAWSSATLRELGGIEGIGVTFLEETFSAPTAPPAHHFHQRAAQAVLKALLPDPSSDLKGRLRPARVLQEAAGYADRPDEFAELIAILDNELRMVTPVDPSAVELEGDGPWVSHGESCYQLTHDYLVPPLRQWLTRKQRETRRGRAELRLATLTALSCDLPESRRLPSLLEWLMILGSTKHRAWSPDERRMMRAAARHYLIRAAAAVAIVGVLTFGIVVVRDRERAATALNRALTADYQQLPGLFPELTAHRDVLRATLEAMEKNESALPHRREVAGILLYREWPSARRATALHARLLVAQPDELLVIRDALAAHPEHARIDELRRLLVDESAEPGARLRVACALVVLEPDFYTGQGFMAVPLAEALLAEHRRTILRWLKLLGPAAPILVSPLGEICRDPDRDPISQTAAAETLAEALSRGHQDLALARVTVETTPEASRILLRELTSLGASDQAIAFLSGVLHERVDDPRAESRKDELAVRQAAAAIALAALGKTEFLWPLLRHRPDPRLRSFLIQRLAADSLPSRILLDRLSLPGIDPIERQALLLAWAETRDSAVAMRAITVPVAAAVVATALVLYRDDPDPGVHSAAELLLRRWRGPGFLAQCEAELRGRVALRDGFRWELDPNGHTFAILPAPLEFRMGSPEHEEGHFVEQVLHYRKIDRSLAVSTKEVTVEQFRGSDPNYRPEPRYGDGPGCAAYQVSWFGAARYCNWLSERAGIDRSQWCYPEDVQPGMTISAEAVQRHGFRLPTEAEWEYFCRSGTETARPYGESPELLSRYAWTWLNSLNRVRPPGQRLPNEFGIFDVLGNVWEWCHDGPAGGFPDVPLPPYPPGTKEHPAGDPARTEPVDASDQGKHTWRIVRGGAFSYAPDKARSAHRDWHGPLNSREYLGFRVVRTLPPRGPSSPEHANPN